LAEVDRAPVVVTDPLPDQAVRPPDAAASAAGQRLDRFEHGPGVLGPVAGVLEFAAIAHEVATPFADAVERCPSVAFRNHLSPSSSMAGLTQWPPMGPSM